MEYSSQELSYQNKNSKKNFDKKINNLSIVVENDDFLQHSSLQNFEICNQRSNIYSVRNANKKQFEFSTNLKDKDIQIQQAVQKLEKLQDEKQKLLQELQDLRNSAINALIQKQEQIQKLKEKMIEITNNHREQQQDKIESVIQQLKTETQKIQQLKNQLSIIRTQYENQLQNKNQLVEELNYQLEMTKLKMEQIKYQDKILNQKLKIAEGENQQLHHQLQNSKNHISELHLSINTQRYQESSQAEDSHRSDFKLLKPMEIHQIDRKYSIWLDEYQENVDELLELIKEEKQKYQKQIEQLQNHYEQKLQMTRLHFQNQLNQYNDSIQLKLYTNQNYQKKYYQCSQSLNSQDYNIQIIDFDQKKARNQLILRTEQDKNQIQAKSIKSNCFRKYSLDKSIQENQDRETDSSTKNLNLNFNKIAELYTKQKYPKQIEKTNQYKNQQKNTSKQNRFHYFTSILKRKSEIGIVIGSAIISTLLISVIKIRK